MALEHIPENELRDYCRRRIETLEVWLRQLIQEKFQEVYASDILAAKRHSDQFVIKAAIRASLEKAINDRPGRYQRAVDAALLGDLIAIICNKQIYAECFVTPLRECFPHGNEQARFVLGKIETPRNHLSHANPISLRQVEQVICYSGDVISSLKGYYKTMSRNQDYDAPRIIRLTDSLGHVAHCRTEPAAGLQFDYSNDPSGTLTVRDVVTLEIEVDPSFEEEGYTVTWSAGPVYVSQEKANKLTFEVTDAHVAQQSVISVRIKSKKPWHRFQSDDDVWNVIYKIIPLR